MKNKKGISLAEVMIVVTIIAIVAIVFLAMPKKKVTKMDKAKYYAAYSMLKSMQDSMLSRSGTAESNNFCTSVHSWLNVTNTSGNCQCQNDATTIDNCVTLINGMTMEWDNNGDVSKRTVTIDLDGKWNGLDTDYKDVHKFYLYKVPQTITDDGEVKDSPSVPLLVTPEEEHNVSGNNIAAGGQSDWIEFRVYQLNSADADTNWDGRKNYTHGTARATYNSAIKIYYECNRDYNDTCFIEAKKPY